MMQTRMRVVVPSSLLLRGASSLDNKKKKSLEGYMHFVIPKWLGTGIESRLGKRLRPATAPCQLHGGVALE